MATRATPRPLTEIPPSVSERVEAVFTDIDDTLTTDGILTSEAFEALWALHNAGRQVVLVTGRPAGWCDHFARMWPITGVIGENGALSFAYDRAAKKMKAIFAQGEEERAVGLRKLQVLRHRILQEVPGSAISSDQSYRLHDLAIDFCEDVTPLPAEAISRIVELFEEAGAQAKVSSIHVNGWFGDFNKMSMARRFALDELGLNLDESESNLRALYVGDSPNDAPAFQVFQNSVGVANVMRFLNILEAPPRYVTERPAGEGFSEVARKLLEG